MKIDTSMQKKIRVGIINNTATSNHFGCVAVMSTIEENLNSLGAEIVFSWPVDYDWRRHKSFLRSCDLDIIIVNGEGSIHHTDTREKAMYLCQIATFAKNELDASCYLINATIYSTCTVANQHLRSFSSIWVRESVSQAYLAEAGIMSEVVPDLSIYSPFLPNPKKGTDPVIVTDSVLPGSSMLLERFASYNNLIFIRMETTVTALLYSRVLAKLRQSCGSPSKFARYEKHDNSRQFQEFIDTVSGSEGLITGRFHSVMLSIAMRTPFLALESNTPKISSVVKDVFGNTSRICEPIALKDPSHRKISSDFSYSAEEDLSLENYTNEGRLKMASMFVKILKSNAR